MTETKSDKLSLHYKNEGNKFFKKMDFDSAITAYNKSLAYAQSKENLAIAYANRSAVCLELEKVKKCFQNIQWARDNGYPADKIQKLDEREERCKKLLAHRNEEKLNDFLKLSYPANPKIPFIIDGLEVRMTEKFGRGIFTTRDLKVGDMIIHETPVFCTMARVYQYEECCNCLNERSEILIPCLKTASLMFCSEKCRDEIYRSCEAENYACLIKNDEKAILTRAFLTFIDAFGGRDNLIKFVKENPMNQWKKTVFDFDFSDPSNPNYKKDALMSLLSYYENGRKFDYTLKEIEKITQGDQVLAKFLEHFGLVQVSSAMKYAHLKRNMNDIGIMKPVKMAMMKENFEFRLNQVGPLINYSCYPNITRLLFNHKVVYYVTSPIKAGNQLFRPSCSPKLFNEPVNLRRSLLQSEYSFHCQCFWCENNLSAGDLPHSIIQTVQENGCVKSAKQGVNTIKHMMNGIQQNEALTTIGTIECYKTKQLVHDLICFLISVT